MNKIIFFLVLLLAVFSCQKSGQSQKIVESVTSKKEVTDSFRDWWASYKTDIELHKDFKALDADGRKITKQDFLKTLSQGNHIPVLPERRDAEITYQLHKLSREADKNISGTVSNEALTFLHYYSLEGSKFPNFSFTDLGGNKISSADLIGKNTIFKTWFINCQACIEEFPKCNDFADKYSDHPGIQFISLATDNPDELAEFLKTKKLNYQTISRQQDLIQRTLGLNVYPTHILVGPDGKIVKMTNNFDDFTEYVELEYELKNLMSNVVDVILPPAH